MDAALGRVIEPAALLGDVSGFLSELRVDTINASNAIAAGTQDPAVREAAVRAKIRMSDAIEDLRQQRDPRLAYLFSWLLVEQSTFYLTEGRGGTLFGEQQQTMIDVMTAARQRVLAIGRTHFPHVNLDEVQEELLGMAQQYVRQHQTFSSRYDAASVDRHADKNAITAMLNIPMTPVSALGGVGDMPTAVDRATQQVQQSSRMIRDMPERVRWQFELAMLQMDQYPTVTKTLAELQAARQSIDRIAATVNELPGSVRTELDATLRAFDESQPLWQQTLTEATHTMEQTRAAVEQANTALAEAQRVRDSLAPLFEEATRTAEAWREVMLLVQAISASDPDAPPDREPVTVRDVADLAHESRAAAVELRHLLAELREPIADESGLMKLSGDWRATLDALAWRAAGLIVLTFALALAFTVVAAKLRTRRAV